MVLGIVIPYLILNPTYTVTSILLSFSGLFLFLNTIKMENDKKSFYFLSGFALALGIAIRIDSLLGLIVFFGPFVVVYLLIKRRNKLKVRSLTMFLLPTFLLLTLQFTTNVMVQSSNNENIQYLKWQENRHELFYTPAILKLHQNVAAGNVLKNTWGDVEFTLLRNWAYGDQSIYSSQNLEIGKKYVDGYIGIKGLINSEPLTVLQTLSGYLEDVKLIILISIGLLILGLSLSKNKYLYIGLISPLVLSFLTSFYYGAAVLRLPIRVTFPYLILFMLLVLFCVEISSISKYANSKLFRATLSLSSIIFLIWFYLFKAFGLFSLIEVNSCGVSLSSNPQFIGPMVHMPSAASGPFNSIRNYPILKNSLVLSWSIFSPSWKSQARDLKINPENFYDSLAKNKDLYFVSEPGLASVVDMYMNDHNILRGKMCPLMDLSGYDNAKIFTFQANENDC